MQRVKFTGPKWGNDLAHGEKNNQDNKSKKKGSFEKNSYYDSASNFDNDAEPTSEFITTRPRSTSAELIEYGTIFRNVINKGCKGNRGVQTVQLFDDGDKKLFISCNDNAHTLSAIDLAVEHNASIDKMNDVPIGLSKKTPKLNKQCATKIPEELNLVLESEPKHAEQNILKNYCKKLVNMENRNELHLLEKTVRLFGDKPPCNICKNVLGAFKIALNKIYDIELRFSTTDGDNSVRELNAGVLSADDMRTKAGNGVMPEKFAEFLNIYEQELAKNSSGK